MQNESLTKKRLSAALQLPILAVLACVAAVCFRKSMGLVIMLPIYPACVFAAGFLHVKRWHRAMFFLSVTAVLNSVENEKVSETVLLLVAATIMFVLCELAVGCIRKKKLRPIAGGAVALLAVLFLNAYLFGNPFSALTAQHKLQEYIDRTYDTQSGSLHFEDFRFDTMTRIYTMTAYSTDAPTDKGVIFYANGLVQDRFRNHLEAQVMYAHAMQLTDALRSAFPNDRFTIQRVGINNFPSAGQKYSLEQEAVDEARVSYCIYVNGKNSFSKLEEAAQKYSDAIRAAGVKYDSITFANTDSLYYRITVTPTSFLGIYCTDFEQGVTVCYYPENHRYLAENGITDAIEAFVEGRK